MLLLSASSSLSFIGGSPQAGKIRARTRIDRTGARPTTTIVSARAIKTARENSMTYFSVTSFALLCYLPIAMEAPFRIYIT